MSSNDLKNQWKQRLANYKTSGKSIAAWCQEHSLKENQFYYWRKKLYSARSEKDQPAKWISLDMDVYKQTSLTSDSLIVHIGQITVEIKKGFDQHLFLELVQILKTL